MFTVRRIRFWFHGRIILVIFNLCECAIRIEPVVIPVLKNAVFPIKHTISIDGNEVPGMDCRIVFFTMGFSLCLIIVFSYILPRGLWLNGQVLRSGDKHTEV